MASSSLPESWACMNMDVSDSNMNNALIMSLWEETQADQEHDEERLRSLIRALEVELDPMTSTTDGHHDMFMDDPQFGSSNSADNFHLQSDVGYANGSDDCSASGFGWVDVEMGSSSQGDHEAIDNKWYLNCDFDEIDCMSSTNFGGPQSTSAPFEEQGHQNVWLDACNTRMLV